MEHAGEHAQATGAATEFLMAGVGADRSLTMTESDCVGETVDRSIGKGTVINVAMPAVSFGQYPGLVELLRPCHRNSGKLREIRASVFSQVRSYDRTRPTRRNDQECSCSEGGVHIRL
jgi:hypothetical protein